MDDLTTAEQTDPPSPRSTNSPIQDSPQLQKIIESTEQIINNQAMKIFQLSQEVINLKKKNNQLTRKIQVYEQIRLTITHEHQPSDKCEEKNTTGALVDKIISLQMQLASVKTQLAISSDQILKEKLKFTHLKNKSHLNNENHEIISPIKLKKSNIKLRFSELEKFVQESMNSVKKFNNKSDHHQRQSQQMQFWSKYIEKYLINAKLPKVQKFKQKTWQKVKLYGIPHELRQSLWFLLFQNKLGIADSLYKQFCRRRISEGVGLEKVVNQIDKDLKRSFVGKTQFQQKVGLREQVTEILQIFHIFRPDISYIQGMTYPIIVLDLIVGKEKAFIIFCNLVIGNTFFRRLFMFDNHYLTVYCRGFQNILKDTYPKVYKTFIDKNIQAEVYLVEWFYTFFSRGISYQNTLRIWDQLAYEGELQFYKLALSIFECLQPLIVEASYEELILMIRQFSSYFDEDKFFQVVNSQKLTQQKLDKWLEKTSFQIAQ